MWREAVGSFPHTVWQVSTGKVQLVSLLLRVSSQINPSGWCLLTGDSPGPLGAPAGPAASCLSSDPHTSISPAGRRVRDGTAVEIQVIYLRNTDEATLMFLLQRGEAQPDRGPDPGPFKTLGARTEATLNLTPLRSSYPEQFRTKRPFGGRQHASESRLLPQRPVVWLNNPNKNRPGLVQGPFCVSSSGGIQSVLRSIRIPVFWYFLAAGKQVWRISLPTRGDGGGKRGSFHHCQGQDYWGIFGVYYCLNASNRGWHR